MKPISAAEKIASIGQTSAISPEINICTPDQLQVKKKGRIRLVIVQSIYS